MEQQEFLRGACVALDMTQKELADRMATSWGTVRKWLAPSGSSDHRPMPDTAWQFVREILAHEQLKAETARLRIANTTSGGHNVVKSSPERTMPHQIEPPTYGDVQEFTFQTKSGRWFQAGIQLVGPGIHTPLLASKPKATKANAQVAYDMLPIRGGAGLEGQFRELLERANARFSAERADRVEVVYLLDGPELLSQAAIAKIVDGGVRVDVLHDAPITLVNLKVVYHPSGRYTLMKKNEGDARWRDCRGDLLANLNAGTFYRAVAQLLHELHQQGSKVAYQDVAVPEAVHG